MAEADLKSGTDHANEATIPPIGALARGLSILDEIVKAPRPLVLGEIALKCGLDQATALRLLRTLEEMGYVLRIEPKRYLPSPKVLKPLALLHPLEQLRRESARPLRELAEKFSMTTVFAVYIGMNRMVVDIALTQNSLSPYYAAWLQGPLHASAPGKALLATMAPDQRKTALGAEPYRQHTLQTKTGWETVQADIEASRKRGYVTVRDELHPGITAIAANVRTWNGNAAGCLVATGQSNHISEDELDRIGAEVTAQASVMHLHAPALQAVVHYFGDVRV